LNFNSFSSFLLHHLLLINIDPFVPWSVAVTHVVCPGVSEGTLLPCE
jgi:hypothetical protein